MRAAGRARAAGGTVAAAAAGAGQRISGMRRAPAGYWPVIGAVAMMAAGTAAAVMVRRYRAAMAAEGDAEDRPLAAGPPREEPADPATTSPDAPVNG